MDFRVGRWPFAPRFKFSDWNRKEETDETFGATLENGGESPFLRTGDLGFLKNGELFVTGRIKDMMIFRGQNHYPQDIEFTVTQSHSSLQPDGCAAFSIEVEGEERLVVIVEVVRHRLLDASSLKETIACAILEHHELQAYAICFVNLYGFKKTANGKVQRKRCKAAFLEGTLE